MSYIHNKYKKDKNAGRNETGYSEETINKYNNYTLQDLQDIELLPDPMESSN